MEPVGRKLKEWILQRSWIGQQQGPLSEIVEKQARQHDCKPRQADRRPAEMPHVRVQRLAPGDGKESGAENSKGHERGCMQQEIERIHWIECGQDAGRQQDSAHAQNPDCDEPDEHDGTEDSADESGPPSLHEKKRDQNRNRERNHDGRQPWSIHFKTLHRAQH